MSLKRVYGIYGASGFGREVASVARVEIDSADPSADLLFIDDELHGQVLNGTKVLSYQQFLELPVDERYVAIAIANGRIRETLAVRLEEDGISSWSIQASSLVKILDNVQIGHGSILCPFVTLTSNIKIGKFFHANIYSYVAHDCVIGDFVTFAPRVSCNGNIVIEDHAYIGTNAVIKQGTPGKPLVIGRGATVGMGAVVTKDVRAGEVVVGNPARVHDKNKCQ